MSALFSFSDAKNTKCLHLSDTEKYFLLSISVNTSVNEGIFNIKLFICRTVKENLGLWYWYGDFSPFI